MPLPFEQLSWVDTPMGVLGLRRRLDTTLGTEVHEVKLGDEYLMSSHFTVAEVARLSRDARTRFVQADLFAALAGGDGFDPDQPARRFDRC